jgi:hypothetical protein
VAQFSRRAARKFSVKLLRLGLGSTFQVESHNNGPAEQNGAMGFYSGVILSRICDFAVRSKRPYREDVIGVQIDRIETG